MVRLYLSEIWLPKPALCQAIEKTEWSRLQVLIHAHDAFLGQEGNFWAANLTFACPLFLLWVSTKHTLDKSLGTTV